MSEQILENLREFLGKGIVSQAEFAKKIQVSSATLNLYLKDKYEGKIEPLEKKISQFLERYQERSQVAEIKLIETETVKKIQSSCQLAFEVKDIFLLIGGSGLGKTVSLKNYAEKTKSAIYFECDLSYTPKNIIKEIAAKLKIKSEKKDFFSLNKAVIQTLEDADFLLIFDEAELLPYKSLETIRRLYDKTNTAIILAGMPRLRANLKGSKGDFIQLFSRVGLSLDLGESLPQNELKQIIKGQGNLAEFAELLSQLANGNSRRLNKLLKGSLRILAQRGEISAETIQSYAEMLIR